MHIGLLHGLVWGPAVLLPTATHAQGSPTVLAQAAHPTPSPDGDPSSSPTVGGPDESMGWTLLRMLAVLGLVLALVYLSLNFGLRRLMGIQGAGTQFGSLVQLVQRIPLDAKKSVYVVRAGKEYLLLGGGESGLSLLCKLDSEEAERIAGERAKPLGASPFLAKLLSRRGAPPPPSA